jgi:hypothetical protein
VSTVDKTEFGRDFRGLGFSVRVVLRILKAPAWKFRAPLDSSNKSVNGEKEPYGIFRDED